MTAEDLFFQKIRKDVRPSLDRTQLGKIMGVWRFTENARKEPRVGQYYVWHDDPKYVYEVIAVDNEKIRLKNCAHKTAADLTDSLKHFHEFFSRVCMPGDDDDL